MGNPTTNEALLRGVTNKDQKKELRKMLKGSWVARVTGGNHVQLIHEPTGAKLQVPLTSSNSRAAKNMTARANRAIRQARGTEA